MTTEQVNTHIESELSKLETIASEHVKRLAMNVLKSNGRKAIEFTMAIGTFFFSNKNGVMWNHEAEDLKGYEELDEFISEWDGILKITGEPMKFKKDGIITTDW